MAELLRSPWAEEFERLIHQAESSLTLCSPYLGNGPCKIIQRHLVSGGGQSGFDLALLTDLSRNNMVSGSTDVEALAAVADTHPNMTIRFLPSLHAKVYVADERRAVVTSANMTNSGLARNFEYGVSFTDVNSVRKIKEDIISYAELGSPIERQQLNLFVEIVRELRDIQRAAERSMRSRLRREFDTRLRRADDEILRARAAGRTAHGIFADAILHILRGGPATTIQMNERIKQIHPDLCDDSVDRVIDGKHFGKKWKHGVRTAQVFLRRRDDIWREGDLWHLHE